MQPRLSRHDRDDLQRKAREICARGKELGRSRDDIVDEIVTRLPGIHGLEAYRIAEGWTRRQMSQAIDALYISDGLFPPHLRTSEISAWEHGRRVPRPERQEYLCRLYRTRPDRLGFGRDFSEPGSKPISVMPPMQSTGSDG